MLAAQRITKRLRGRLLVEDVSLHVNRGETVGLFGPNGAGKTTLFSILAGTEPADDGRILLDQVDITAAPMYRRARLGMSYLSQEPCLVSGLTVEQNMLLALETREPSPAVQRRRLENLLEEFGIAHVRKTKAARLSGGERRRCEIACVLSGTPSFILLDEPFAGIDPIAASEIRALVRSLTQRGIGVLVTDHSIREALSLVDRAYILESGSILMEGTADAVLLDPEVQRSYLGPISRTDANSH